MARARSTWDQGQSRWDRGASRWDQSQNPVDQFRDRFPAFKDPAVYSDEMIEDWLQLATCMVDQGMWGCLYEFGVGLWAAHEMAKMRMAELASEEDPTGLTGGAVNSKSVGPVSVSYNTQIGLEDAAAGHYNMTIYGRQFWHYAKLIGMGPWQVGGISSSGPLTASGWMGPVYGVWPNWALIG